MAFNIENLFVYRTVRIVEIKSKKLFLTYLFFITMICLYTLCWTFGFKKNYLLFEKPQGTVRTSLRHPAPKFSHRIEDLAYCGNDVYQGTDWNILKQMPCKDADTKLVVYPPSEETAMLVTTRLSIQKESLPPNCDPFSAGANCTFKKEGKKETLFITDPEMYTLFIDHSMDGAQSSVTMNSKFMKGRMLDQDDNEIDPCDDYPKGQCPKYIACGEVNKPDIVPLKTVLRAAGMTLDSLAHPSMAIGEADWESHRHAGVVLLFRIYYDNIHSFNAYDIEYTYTVSAERNTEYKVEEPVLGTKIENGQVVHTRTILDRHGIRLIFQQTGKIGSFDFQTFLVNAVSSLSLVTVATLVVDLLAVYVMSRREFYKKCKYMTPIEDADDLRKNHPGLEENVISPLLKEA